jgi:hypothetical protein
MLRKEKALKEASPPQKDSKKKEPKKKKQNQKKKKDYDVKLDKESFLIYDQSLFSSFEAPEWLDAEQEWGVGAAYCTNYGGRVSPFAPEW